MENETYKHTQMGWTTSIAVFVPLLICLGAIFTVPDEAAEVRNVLIAVAVILAIVLLLFFTLTVRVNATHLQVSFGPGLIRRTITRADIESIEAVRNKWWYGFGIRYVPSGGWMFNTSGLDAVQLVFKNGKRFRIGTDDPEGLVTALRN